MCKAGIRNIIAVNKILSSVSDIGLKHILRHEKLSLELDLPFKTEMIGLDKRRPIVFDSECGDQ